jgi:hypothetical protein
MTGVGFCGMKEEEKKEKDSMVWTERRAGGRT